MEPRHLPALPSNQIPLPEEGLDSPSPAPPRAARPVCPHFFQAADSEWQPRHLDSAGVFSRPLAVGCQSWFSRRRGGCAAGYRSTTCRSPMSYTAISQLKVESQSSAQYLVRQR